MTSSRRFYRLGGRRDVQLNFTRYWAWLGLRTWPPVHAPGYKHHGRQKRAIHFGAGYLSWRIH